MAGEAELVFAAADLVADVAPGIVLDSGLDAGIGFGQVNDRAERVEQVELHALGLVVEG